MDAPCECIEPSDSISHGVSKVTTLAAGKIKFTLVVLKMSKLTEILFSIYFSLLKAWEVKQALGPVPNERAGREANDLRTSHAREPLHGHFTAQS